MPLSAFPTHESEYDASICVSNNLYSLIMEYFKYRTRIFFFSSFNFNLYTFHCSSIRFFCLTVKAQYCEYVFKLTDQDS